MEAHENLIVLRRLRDGRDPATGETLPPEHLCQRVDVVRALFAAVDAVERAGPPAPEEPATAAPPGRARRTAAPKAGQPWSDEDDRRLVEAFDGGADLRELAESFGRSRNSIRARLVLLGRGALLGDGPAPRWPVAQPTGSAEAPADVPAEEEEPAPA